MIPGSGRSLGEEKSYPCQYSCLENPRGQRSQAGYSPRGSESDMTERLTLELSFFGEITQIFYYWPNQSWLPDSEAHVASSGSE